METNGTLTFQEIKTKAIHGAISLTFRRVVLAAINFAVINLFLLKFVPPSTIGTFNLAALIITFFGYFSDVGLGASLIQKKEIEEHDITTTFVIQEILVGLISLAIFLLAPYIASFYRLESGGTVLIQVLAISFFVVSFKVIPSVLLERNLNFRPMVTVEIIETIIFNALLVMLTLNQFGLYAFAIAQIVRAIVGTTLLYNLAPWKMRFRYHAQAAKDLLKFGVPFQTNSLLALAKDRLVPLVIAKMITTSQLGYVTVAQSWAFLPLEVMNILIRVMFPAFARLQHDRIVLGRAVERCLYAMGLLLYPAMFGVLALIPQLVDLVGREKWGQTIPLVYLFSFATFWASISTTYTNVFNAVGQIKITFKLMVMWVVLEWIFTPILVWQMGFIGVGVASAIISFSSIVTILYMRSITEINLIKSIGKPLVASAIMGLFLYGCALFLLTSKILLIPLIGLGGLLYVTIMWLWDKERLTREAKEIIHAIR